MKKSLTMLIAAIAMVGCASNSTEKSETAATETAAAATETAVVVKTAMATTETVELTETYTSEIKPYKENDITPAYLKPSGRVWVHEVLLHTSYSACIAVMAPADEPLMTMFAGSTPSWSAFSMMKLVALKRSSTAMWMALSRTFT